ncbi:hypothetical protein BDZ90DRAFT_230746 [Jaminaea rosea]|uniref:Uncharacterized protein n=1 Tax=Jaminaea rosea TaxID=1569628 RepID=A0A316UTU8_9BASI|nr:hypothetical protein BDZ90DRAFT_230746 [Jaminaea rosea]PWN28726.1 hypothetical protein BDZ90DRAFT_230746 [Jaminaea rosea]
MQLDDDEAQLASGSSSAQPYAQQLLSSILPSSTPRSEVAEHYETRLKDKKVQLANPDRRRPRSTDGIESSGGAHTAKKLAKRQKKAGRVLRKPAKAMQKEQAAAAAAAAAREGGSRRPPAHRGIQGLDEEMSYTALLPLHHFWTSYIQQFLNLVRSDPATQEWLPNAALLDNTSRPPRWRLTESAIANVQQQICKADLLGALMRVERAANPSLVGLEGLVARETEHTIVLAHRCAEGEDGVRSKKAKRIFKVVPKHNAVFVVRVPLPDVGEKVGGGSPTYLEMPLQGNQMEGQMVTRATRKWKQKRTMDF